MALAPAAAALISGCGSHDFTGHSGTCTYGLGAGTSGLECYQRPNPSARLRTLVDTPRPLTQGLSAWRRSHGAALVTSVGIDAWAETTFAEGRGSDEKLVTFDADGRPTKGDDGYVSSPHDPFPVSRVSTAAYERLVQRLDGGPAGARVLRAVISADPFQHGLITWRLAVYSAKADSHILYEATANGAELCHATDFRPNDALRPLPSVPVCGNGNVLPF